MKTNFPELEPAYNPEPERGISSSIKLGLMRLDQLGGESQACLFTVAAQSGLTARSIGALIDFWQRHSFGITAVSCGEMIGNPVIFSARYYSELKELTKDCGGKKILMRHREDAGFCEISRSGGR